MSRAARLGARRALTLVGGDLAWGLAFGAAARAAGLTLAETAAMSGLVYAGTAQLAALALWTAVPAALPLTAIVGTTLVVNLRHLMLGVTAAPWLGRASGRRVAAGAFFLSDETWALTATERTRAGGEQAGLGFLVGSGATLWIAWVGASAAGHLAGGVVRDPERWALDFAAVAALLLLIATLCRGRRDAPPWLAAAAVSIAASRLLPGSWHIVIGAATACLAGGWLEPARTLPSVDAGARDAA